MPLLTSYTFQDTVFHRLDPRTKMAWLGVMLVLCFATRQGFLLAGFIVLVLALSWVARLDLKCFIPVTRVFASLALGVVLIQTIFYSGEDTPFHLGPADLHVQGFWLAVRVTLRLYCVILLFLQFLTWTHPTDLSLVLVKARLPYRYAMLIGLTLRFFPVLEEELGNILAAQEARGMELQGSMRRALNMVPVMLPFCLRALRRANEVALAMELRGYGFRPQRTFLRSVEYRPADYAATIGMLICLVAYFVVRWRSPSLL
ncbi:MAG: energy-coupling factor transporter transmembrane protein EcfT [Actinobacteria bacterium]|nr:energy-coupling factor transporter transmembrane protein EcfT [Actinomycetota bacterium]MCL5026467.1 energy-coupling factor transporter transmembrane protein EcfT [Chloroflexota bacterium]